MMVKRNLVGLVGGRRMRAVSVAAAMSATAALAFAGSASAVREPMVQLKNAAVNRCLNSNHEGDVYLSRCSPSDSTEYWRTATSGTRSEIVNNHNFGTAARPVHLCLDANVHEGVFTRACAPGTSDPYQVWTGQKFMVGKRHNQLQVVLEGVGDHGLALDGNIRQGVFPKRYDGPKDLYQRWDVINAK